MLSRHNANERGYCQKPQSESRPPIVWRVVSAEFDWPKVEGLSKVPGEASFTIDLRSQEPEVLAELYALLGRLATEIGKARNVRFGPGRLAQTEPTVMDPTFRAVLQNAANEFAIKAPLVPCGAGHDAAESCAWVSKPA